MKRFQVQPLFTLIFVGIAALSATSVRAQETPCSSRNPCLEGTVQGTWRTDQDNANVAITMGVKAQKHPAKGWALQGELSNQAGYLRVENKSKLLGIGTPGRHYWALGAQAGFSPIDRSTKIDAKIGKATEETTTAFGIEAGRATNFADPRLSGKFIGGIFDGSRWLTDNVRILGAVRADFVRKGEIKDADLARQLASGAADHPQLDQNFMTFTGEIRAGKKNGTVHYIAGAVHENKNSKLLYTNGDPAYIVHKVTLFKGGVSVAF
jgi:hypothetical protein